MSHETTATRKFVAAEVAEHAADAVSHVTAQERARWDALAAGADGKSVYVKSFTPSVEAGGTSVLVLHDERTDEDVEVRVLNGADGAPGAPLTWADLTAEQKASLKGDPGPVNWGDLTAEQKAELKDELRFKYSDFTPAQLAALKGAKGDPGETGAPGPAGESFTYSMFSQEQLAALKGPKGDTGDTGPAFVFAKTYASVAAMTADFSGTDTEAGDHVLISASGADNAKVYRKGASAWEFVVQLAGPQGPAGPRGQAGSPGSPGRDGEDGLDGVRGSRIFGGSGVFSESSSHPGIGTISAVVAGGDVDPEYVQADDWYLTSAGQLYRCVEVEGDVYSAWTCSPPVYDDSPIEVEAVYDDPREGWILTCGGAGVVEVEKGDATSESLTWGEGEWDGYSVIGSVTATRAKVTTKLWVYVGSLVGPKGDKGDQGEDGEDGEDGAPGVAASFAPVSGVANVVNMSSGFAEFSAAGQLTLPLPTVAQGQLLEYVLYVQATAAVTVGQAAYATLRAAGYTVRSNSSYVEDNLAAGTMAAYTVAQMGSSMNVMVMRTLLTHSLAPTA